MRARAHADEDQAFRASVERLAKAFKVNAEGFCDEYRKMMPIAMHYYNSGHQSNLTAWQAAVAATKGRNRRTYTMVHLGPPLVGYASWKVITSGVEQNFSIREWYNTKRRDLPEQSELDILQIMTHKLEEPLDDLVASAQKVWSVLYGEPRTSNARLKGWKKRKIGETISDDTPKGLTMIMRERREKVSKLTHGQSMSRSEIHGVARSAAGDAWSAGHEKEAARQIALKEIRWLEAADKDLIPDKDSMV